MTFKELANKILFERGNKFGKTLEEYQNFFEFMKSKDFFDCLINKSWKKLFDGTSDGFQQKIIEHPHLIHYLFGNKDGKNYQIVGNFKFEEGKFIDDFRLNNFNFLYEKIAENGLFATKFLGEKYIKLIIKDKSWKVTRKDKKIILNLYKNPESIAKLSKKVFLNDEILNFCKRLSNVGIYNVGNKKINDDIKKIDPSKLTAEEKNKLKTNKENKNLESLIDEIKEDRFNCIENEVSERMQYIANIIEKRENKFIKEKLKKAKKDLQQEKKELAEKTESAFQEELRLAFKASAKTDKKYKLGSQKDISKNWKPSNEIVKENLKETETHEVILEEGNSLKTLFKKLLKSKNNKTVEQPKNKENQSDTMAKPKKKTGKQKKYVKQKEELDSLLKEIQELEFKKAKLENKHEDLENGL